MLRRLPTVLALVLTLLSVASLAPASAAPPAPSGIVGPSPQAPLTNTDPNAPPKYLAPGQPPTVNGPVTTPTQPTPAQPYDCLNSPKPADPGRGISGWIDPGPAHPAGDGLYSKYGPPPPFVTYDLGCMDWGTKLDTLFGKWTFGVAVTLVATEDSLHRMISPPVFLDAFNPLVRRATDGVQRALYQPWLPLSLLLLGVVLAANARKKNLPVAVSATLWALLVLVLATGIIREPEKASRVADSTSVWMVGQVNEKMLGEDMAAADPASKRAELLNQSVLYQHWLRGMLGSDSSSTATQYGPDLYDAMTKTRAEQAEIAKDPKAAAGINARHQAKFKDVASKVEEADADAYEHLKGQTEGRWAAGLIAIFAALVTSPFTIAADLLVLVSLVLIRIGVIAFPGIAVFGIHAKLAPVVKGTGGAMFAALVNSILFAAGAAVQILATGWLLSTSTGLQPLAAFVICGVVSYVLWKLLKPLRKLTAMVRPTSPLKAGADAIADTRQTAVRRTKWLANKASNYSIGREATQSGVAHAMDGSKQTDQPTENGTHSSENESRPVREPTPDRQPIADTYNYDSQRPERWRAVATAAWQRWAAVHDPEHGPDQDREGGEIPPDVPPEELPSRPYRADSVPDEDGRPTWQTWDPERGVYVHVPGTRSEASTSTYEKEA
jgi:hypothetical protein